MRLRISILLLLTLLVLVSCRSSEPIPKTAEEVAFARLAVLEMMELTLTASSDNLYRESGWRGTVADLVPREAALLIQRIDTVPGLRRLMDRYLGHMNRSIAIVAAELPEYVRSSILPALEIDDPFLLVEGTDDAVTRHFAATATNAIENWLEQRLHESIASEALESWHRVLRMYHTYNRSQQIIRGDDIVIDGSEIVVDPVRTVVVTILRQLLANMREQELLVRAMAPAYDNPLITPFARR